MDEKQRIERILKQLFRINHDLQTKFNCENKAIYNNISRALYGVNEAIVFLEMIKQQQLVGDNNETQNNPSVLA